MPDDVSILRVNPSDNAYASTNTTVNNGQSTTVEKDKKARRGSIQENKPDVVDEETVRATIKHLFRIILITNILCPGLFVLYYVVRQNFRGDIDLLAKFKPIYPDFIRYFDVIAASLIFVTLSLFYRSFQIFWLDDKFAFPDDRDLNRNFYRKIAPSDTFVLDCLWFLTILDGDVVHGSESDSEMEAFIKCVSNQDAAWKQGRFRHPKLEWVVGFILFAVAIMALCLQINIKLLVYFMKACNHTILLNGKTEAFTAYGPTATTQGIIGYTIFILLVNVWSFACCLLVKFVACYQGSKKLVVLINQDIQGMKKKFGNDAGTEMAKVWNERIDRTRQWLWAGNTIHYLSKTISEALEDMVDHLKNIIDLFYQQ